MSWVEKNRKINNQGGDDYSGLESTLLTFFLKKVKTSIPFLRTKVYYRHNRLY